jgi:hypothetical protein
MYHTTFVAEVSRTVIFATCMVPLICCCAHFPQCPFARYADDAVVHCRSEAQAHEIMCAIASRLAECGWEMHPEKSGIVYCRDRSRTQAYAHDPAHDHVRRLKRVLEARGPVTSDAIFPKNVVHVFLAATHRVERRIDRPRMPWV